MAPERPEKWKVRFTAEAARWFNALPVKDAEKIGKAVDKLELEGPQLRRPLVGLIKGSRHHNMKELRAVGGHFRALVAFDRQSQAIVLIGGDKTHDWKGWYGRNIRRADQVYDKHLHSTGDTRLWTMRTSSAGARYVGRER